ncbi:hypothetical protein [Nocardioides mesophilus]|uniref:Phosphatase PAP2 family protein n=1 Tax=Nocardioides mesophilus TaxID=433659 RepID=A0A7G9R799_9ACTN|nr:hypothetical protein [Nocardioides mesophilus]QNN51474.1 hypothetical protein H9L09_12795 [Nocardioides mesophilus]
MRRRQGRPAGRRGHDTRLVVTLVVAVLAVTLGLLAPWGYATFVNTSAKDRIEAAPPPPLFTDSQVAPTAREVLAQGDPASAMLQQWWSGHGRARDDAAFTAWLESSFPAPPGESTRKAQMAEVERLDLLRSDAGVKAASWLESFGKDDVWKLYAHDQGEMLAAAVGDSRKSHLKDMLKMSKDVADALGARFGQSAPYVTEPRLRPDHTVVPGQVCPCSYPSRHAAAGAAARSYLGALDPHRAEDYRWTESQIDYSRVYMAGHYPADVDAGALLGDMIGQYFLVTREHRSPAQAAAGPTPEPRR